MRPIVRNALPKLVVVALLVYGTYTGWLAIKHETAWFLLWTVPCLAGGIGLALSRPWSRYLVYIVAFCTVIGWAAFVALYWSSVGEEAIAKLFALGAALIVLSVGSSVVVFRHFKHNATQI